MFLLLAIGACGAWCAYYHWMRSAGDESVARREFWLWAARGLAFPVVIWALANIGFGDRFPALAPFVAEAKAARQPWMARWFAVVLAGSTFILTYWGAISYCWILGGMFRQATNRAELLFNVAVFGFFSGLCGAALIFASGVAYSGAALLMTLVPIVYFTSDMAEAIPPRPTYDRALGQINFGKYEAAEWELISQLERKEDDFQGWLMLAELYARQHKNMEDAARVILDVCQNPKTQPAEISLACHKLADWQMELAGNPDGARAALALLCRKLPDTHFARMAQQRMKQLPRDAAEMEESKKPRRINLPALSEREGKTGPRLSRGEAMTEVNRLTEQLTADPNDTTSRERFARVLADDLAQVDLGIEQLNLLIAFPEASDRERARWLGQIAAWELDLRKNEKRYLELLRDLIRKYPQSAEAFAAQRQLFLHGQDDAQDAAVSSA